jgi:O-antigen/teichoic acid export membrane protein
MGERMLTMLLALTIHVWLARYLGPENFGVLSYAIAFVGLFGTFTYLGLSGLVIRDLVSEPNARGEILGTVFALKSAGGAVGLLCILLVVFFKPSDSTTRVVVALTAGGLTFQAFRVIEFWFASRIEARYSVLASSAATIAASIGNAALILAGAPLVAFAIVLILQPAVLAVGLLVTYRARGGRVSRWRFNRQRAKKMLSQSWPLALASVGAIIYLKIDQVMLGMMTGAEQVGVYAVAARLSEVWYFIPTALALSVFPKIVESRREGEATYNNRLQRTYNVLAALALCIALGITVLSGPVIDFLYDGRYADASRILIIHIWASPAMFMGALLSKWLIAEGLLTFSFTRHLLGAVTNVGLNVILIPKYGGVGAAFATLVAYTFASYVACFSDSRTRIAGRMMTRAVLAPLTLWRSEVR